jgi:hypothetical protein
MLFSQGLSNLEIVTMTNSGFATKDNLKDWSARAKENSFHQDKAESRHNIGCEGCDEDIEEGIPELPKQKREEGDGFAPIDKLTARNTYTSNKGGTERD